MSDKPAEAAPGRAFELQREGIVTKSITERPVESLDELLSGTSELPVLPEIAIRIFEEMRAPNVSAARMAEFVKKDPVLASTVLRIANSALYGGRSEISDLAFAIARVGLGQIRNLLLAIVLRSKMADPKVYGEQGPRLMDHGLAVAFAAGLVADSAGVESSEAFMCGLLHDFGKLALVKALRERSGGSEPNEDETALISAWHGEAGAKLAASWDLPQVVVASARYHHDPAACPDGERSMAAAVGLANAIAHRLGLGAEEEPELDLEKHPATLILDLGAGQIDEIADHLPGLFGTARSALFG